MNVLELTGLAVGYRARRRQKVVLKGLEASLEEGHLVGLVGPNGAGKSTLLRTVSGLQPPLAGSVRLLGRDLERMRRDDMARQVAVVLTDRVDPGRLTVADVIALGRHPHTGWSGRLGVGDRKAVAVALEAVGAEELAERMLGELSDGQRQRVMIARAIAQAPRLLLLDEPTAFLDPPGRIRVFELLQDLACKRGIAVVVRVMECVPEFLTNWPTTAPWRLRSAGMSGLTRTVTPSSRTGHNRIGEGVRGKPEAPGVVENLC